MPQSDPPARERDDDARPSAAQKRTPGPDVQPADAGTPASGNTGTPATPVMKQFSKTDAERGGRQR
ncbi:hypothetical protein FN976_22605 [Caenimonas sedimenti]|uniref:Uncharacterized protein n=1 Tax=Caenimonas sedimenti TaxID=2596921 RepID=A0A562ZJA5_9BURK|nr:hypothetical protein [Caenimonas sedimenti]TWO68426.1 hypothetical protein FN976_22605 [Caenimonas sedimenti]